MIKINKKGTKMFEIKMTEDFKKQFDNLSVNKKNCFKC